MDMCAPPMHGYELELQGDRVLVSKQGFLAIIALSGYWNSRHFEIAATRNQDGFVVTDGQGNDVVATFASQEEAQAFHAHLAKVIKEWAQAKASDDDGTFVSKPSPWWKTILLVFVFGAGVSILALPVSALARVGWMLVSRLLQGTL
jgi:hypothetical protein